MALTTASMNLAGQLIARDTTDTTEEHKYLSYTPSAALALIGFIAYGCLALALSWQFFRHRGKFMLVMIGGTYIYAIGLVLRIPLRSQMTSFGLFMAQNLMTTLAPCLFIATEYMILGRLAAWLRCTRFLLIPAGRITLIFVMSDVCTFMIQGAGGGLMASSSSGKLGNTIFMIGITIQLISFVVFVVIFLWFLHKVRTEDSSTWCKDEGKGWRKDWRGLSVAIGLSCVGVLIRSFYRVIELSGGYNSRYETTESYFYILDALPLCLALCCYIPFFPGRFIPDGLNLKAVASEDVESLTSPSQIRLKQYQT